MPQYIDFYLSENRFSRLIECLEEYCEKSDSFFEIEEAFYIIKDLEEQKGDFYRKLQSTFENQ